MRQLQSILAIILACLFSYASGQSIINFADSIRIKNKIPEIAFAAIMPDTVLESSVLGYHKFGSKDTASIKDRFHIGSNTKAMTAFIAAKLIETGKINWETKFFDLFPDWKRESDTAFWNLTLRELLSHRGRIPPYTDGAEFKPVPKHKGSNQNNRILFCKYILQQKPIPIVDSFGFSYSNAGYSLVATMLEKATSKSWEELAVTTFKTDLGINVGFSWPNINDVNQPWGHWKEKDSIIALPPDDKYDLKLIEPGGDINISLSDYIKFIQLNLNGLIGKDNYLRSGTYKKLLIDSKNNYYAMGWSNKIIDGKLYSTHSGSAGTFYARVVIDHPMQIAYIVMSNIDTEESEKGLKAIIEKMKTKYGR